MSKYVGNPPREFRPQYRLLVTARQQLPKRFIWQIIHEDGNGKSTVIRNSSPETFATMDSAYERGKVVLGQFRARLNQG